MTRTLKTLLFFICYHPSPRQPAAKVQSFGREGWGYSEGGQIKKLTFHCFLLCLRASVCQVFLAAWNNIAGCCCCCCCFKSVGIPVFLLMQCKSGSLYFLHKLLNETAYLRRGGNYGLFCVPYGGEETDRWEIDGRKKPFRGRSCALCKELQGFTHVMTYLK